MKKLIFILLLSLSSTVFAKTRNNAGSFFTNDTHFSKLKEISDQSSEPCNCDLSAKDQISELQKFGQKLPKFPGESLPTSKSETDSTLDWNTFKNEYGNRPEITKLIDSLNSGAGKIIGKGGKIKKGSKSKRRFTKLCYRYVKAAMLNAGLSKKYLGGAKASDAGSYLKKEGFINILNNPDVAGKINSLKDFPTGTILVYSGGKAGHIEIKTNNGYISDFINERPVIGSPEKSCQNCKNKFTGRNRKLIGAYVLGDAFNKVNFANNK
jgi:hypothetical protein